MDSGLDAKFTQESGLGCKILGRVRLQVKYPTCEDASTEQKVLIAPWQCSGKVISYEHESLGINGVETELNVEMAEISLSALSSSPSPHPDENQLSKLPTSQTPIFPTGISLQSHKPSMLHYKRILYWSGHDLVLVSWIPLSSSNWGY